MALPFYTAWKTVSSTPSEYWKDSFQALVDEQFENSPTIKTVTHNGTAITVRVVGKFNGETLTRNNDDYQKIIFSDYDYVVSIGDLFVFDSLTYLCTGITSNTVSKSCSVQLCNNTLSFYSPTSLTDSTPILNQIHCIIGKASISQDENKFISLPADENIVTLANTADSLKITENTRFILGVKTYKVIGINDIETPGLLTIKIKEDQLIPDEDNEVLGIANYWSNQHTYTIFITNNTTASFGIGQDIQINVDVYKDGILMDSPVVVYTNANKEVATISETGLLSTIGSGTTIVGASSHGVSTTIAITITDEVTEDVYTVSITGNSTVKLNNNIILNASIFNNGSLDLTKSVVWQVSNQDLSSNIYVSIVSQDSDSIELKATSNNSYVNRYVVIRASKNDDSLIYKEHIIQIKSLF